MAGYPIKPLWGIALQEISLLTKLEIKRLKDGNGKVIGTFYIGGTV